MLNSRPPTARRSHTDSRSGYASQRAMVAASLLACPERHDSSYTPALKFPRP
jgi:hypothetical protein